MSKHIYIYIELFYAIWHSISDKKQNYVTVDRQQLWSSRCVFCASSHFMWQLFLLALYIHIYIYNDIHMYIYIYIISLWLDDFQWCLFLAFCLTLYIYEYIWRWLSRFILSRISSESSKAGELTGVGSQRAGTWQLEGNVLRA